MDNGLLARIWLPNAQATSVCVGRKREEEELLAGVIIHLFVIDSCMRKGGGGRIGQGQTIVSHATKHLTPKCQTEVCVVQFGTRYVADRTKNHTFEKVLRTLAATIIRPPTD